MSRGRFLDGVASERRRPANARSLRPCPEGRTLRVRSLSPPSTLRRRSVIVKRVPRRGFRPLILCYHAVTDAWEHALAIGPAQLERQVAALLRRGWSPGTADDALDGRNRVLHVTFDDAFRSISRALPILEALRVPATVFVCSGYAEDGRPLDVPELATDAARQPHELATMPWDEIRELRDRGVEIGSHTVNHPRLTQLGDEELRRELGESRERLEAELGRPCRFLAYPYGDEDERVHQAAEDAGYEAAFALPGRERPLNRYALPRIGIYRGTGRFKVWAKTSPQVRRVAGTLAALGRRGR